MEIRLTGWLLLTHIHSSSTLTAHAGSIYSEVYNVMANKQIAYEETQGELQFWDLLFELYNINDIARHLSLGFKVFDHDVEVFVLLHHQSTHQARSDMASLND